MTGDQIRDHYDLLVAQIHQELGYLTSSFPVRCAPGDIKTVGWSSSGRPLPAKFRVVRDATAEEIQEVRKAATVRGFVSVPMQKYVYRVEAAD